MTTIQSVPHAFSSASKVTVSPFQQSPNKYFFVSSKNEKTNYQTKRIGNEFFKKKKELHIYKQSHVIGRKDGDLQ